MAEAHGMVPDMLFNLDGMPDIGNIFAADSTFDFMAAFPAGSIDFSGSTDFGEPSSLNALSDINLLSLDAPSDSNDMPAAPTQGAAQWLVDGTNVGPVPNEASALVVLADRSTWAARNPTSTTQPTRDPKRKLTQAERDRRVDAAVGKRDNEARLHADIGAYLESTEQLLSAIASRHSIKVEKVKLLVNTKTNYTSDRDPNLYNAQVHYMTSVLNEGLPPGSKKTLGEIQRQIRDENLMIGMPKEHKNMILDLLVKHREAQKTGTRVNNKPAQMDVIATTNRMAQEADNLFARTGYSILSMGARNHVNDDSDALMWGSGDAESFPAEVLGKTQANMTQLFEQWNCKRDTTIMGRETAQSVRAECTAYIKNGLQAITKDGKLEMAYQKYKQKIVIPYQVQLVGHPFKNTTGGAPFKDPGALNTMVDLRTLRAALKSKQCYWARISSTEAEAVNKELRALQATGSAPQRKSRSDANVARGPNKRTRDNGENEDPSVSVLKSKRAKASKKSKPTTAAAKGKGKGKGKGKEKQRASTSNDMDSGDSSDSDSSQHDESRI